MEYLYHNQLITNEDEEYEEEGTVSENDDDDADLGIEDDEDME